jgi:hypothetical protein
MIIAYLILHGPAFMWLVIGYLYKNDNPKRAKKLYIAAGVYFIIGGGICGAILHGLNQMH